MMLAVALISSGIFMMVMTVLIDRVYAQRENSQGPRHPM